MTRSDALQDKLDCLYNFIVKTVDERGYPPTVREICTALNIKSTGSVSYYMRKLEDSGRLKIDSGKSRGIGLTESTRAKLSDFVQVPLIGRIPAGQPMYAFEDYEDTYALPGNLFSLNGDTFMLRVTGTSMIEAGINDGDFIIVKRQSSANNGQIVVAFVENENATVKRFFKEGNRVRLHPENKNMSDFYPEEMSVLGVVVGLIRTNIA